MLLRNKLMLKREAAREYNKLTPDAGDFSNAKNESIETASTKVNTDKAVPEAQQRNGESVVEKTEGSENEHQYTQEGIREEIHHKAEKIRGWTKEMGYKEGEDFLIIEDIRQAAQEGEQIAPHELKQFFVIILEDRYPQFREYLSGRYAQERAAENPKGKVKFDYSWGGRFLVGGDGVPFDTVAAKDIKNLTVDTHHNEFKKFFKIKAGFEFPSQEVLNPILREMADTGLDYYEQALAKLKALRDNKQLPRDGYGLIDTLEHATIILKNAKSGEAVIELPDTIGKEGMPPKMRHYADLTYNAEDIKNFDRVYEITGVKIPDESRMDKIFDQFGFDRNKMEEICKNFSDYIMAKKTLK